MQGPGRHPTRTGREERNVHVFVYKLCKWEHHGILESVFPKGMFFSKGLSSWTWKRFQPLTGYVLELDKYFTKKQTEATKIMWQAHIHKVGKS